MKNFFYITLLFYLFSITGVFSQDTVDIKESNKAFMFGKQQYNAGKYKEALEFFSKSIKTNPDNVEAYYYRILSADKSGKLDSNISFYKQQITMLKKEDDPRIHFALACSYLIKSQTGEEEKINAREEINKVIALDKDGPWGTRIKELAKEYNFPLESSTGKTGLTDYKLILYIIIGIVLGIIILVILISIIKKLSVPKVKFTGTIIMVNPEGQIILNNRLESLPKKDKVRLTLGKALTNDIILEGNNIGDFHAVLMPIKHLNRDRMKMILVDQKGVITRETDGKSDQIREDILWDGDKYKIGDYSLEFNEPTAGKRPVPGGFSPPPVGGQSFPSLPKPEAKPDNPPFSGDFKF